MNHKTTVKLVWVLVAIVLMIGVMRLVMLHSAQTSQDHTTLMR